MKYEQISALLEKYWEGETSLQEERELKNYFASGAVDPRLHSIEPLFRAVREDQGRQFTAPVPAPRRLTIVATVWRTWAVAASVAGLLFLGWLFRDQLAGPAGKPMAAETKNLQEDTYDDPEKAAAEIKAALALVSSKLNKGKKEAAKGLRKMEKVDKYIIGPKPQ
jgi:hypothetical protein